MRRHGSSLLILYLATAGLQASMNMAFLALPIYALSVLLSPFEIGLIGASGGLTYSLTARLLGGLSDKYSKRVFVVLGSILQATAAGLYSLFSSTQYLLPLRIVQSLGLALFWPAIEAMIAAEARDGAVEHALAAYNVSWSTANIVSSPIAGFLITAFTLTLPFHVSSALALIMAILLLPLKQKTGHSQVPVRVVQAADTARANKLSRLTFLLSVLGAFAYAFNGSIVGTLFPVSATGLGISPIQIGFLFFLSNLAQTLVFIFSERLIRRFKKGSFPIGVATLILSLIPMALVRDATTFAPSFIGLGFGQGILYSSSLYYILTERVGDRGYATGNFEGTLGLASFLGPLIGGASTRLGPSYPYVVGALTNILILVTELFIKSRASRSDLAPEYG